MSSGAGGPEREAKPPNHFTTLHATSQLRIGLLSGMFGMRHQGLSQAKGGFQFLGSLLAFSNTQPTGGFLTAQATSGKRLAPAPTFKESPFGYYGCPHPQKGKTGNMGNPVFMALRETATKKPPSRQVSFPHLKVSAVFSSTFNSHQSLWSRCLYFSFSFLRVSFPRAALCLLIFCRRPNLHASHLCRASAESAGGVALHFQGLHFAPLEGAQELYVKAHAQSGDVKSEAFGFLGRATQRGRRHGV